jgi:hypothetical protein
MDPATFVLALGFLGGLVIAFFIGHRGRHAPSSSDPFARISTDVINAARIRVAGVGGLGLVAMALVVAAFVPSIRQSLALGLTLGVVLAVVLILWRRRQGPMPSSGRHAGATTTLSIDSRPTATEGQDRDSTSVRAQGVAVPAISARPL